MSLSSKSTRKNFYLVENRTGGKWGVRRATSTTTIQTFARKRDAVDRAKQLAVNQVMFGVLVEDQSGDFQKFVPARRSQAFEEVYRRVPDL